MEEPTNSDPNGALVMLRLALIMVFLSAFALGTAAPASGRFLRSSARSDAEQAEVDRPWGTPSSGLKSRIWVKRATFGPGDPIEIHYEIQNASREEQAVWHSGFWPNHRIDVTGPDGKPAKLTERGAEVRAAFDPDGPRSKNFGRKLAPGESDAAWEAYDLRGLYLLARPGAYKVQYVYQQGATKPVKSNTLKLVIE
jgi:hypothetical protein